MLCTKKDIHRIVTKTSIPVNRFISLNNDGYRMLRNKRIGNKDQCYFLTQNGLCSIYDIRPEGCQFYPLIWDMTEHKLIVDDYCPHHGEFKEAPGISKKLEDFIYKLYGRH